MMRLFLVLMLLVSSSCSEWTGSHSKYSESRKLGATTAAKSIEISSFNGSISIHFLRPGTSLEGEGSDTGPITSDMAWGNAKVYAKAENASDAEARAKAIQVQFEDIDGVLSCIAKKPDDDFQCGVKLDLYLPCDLPITIKTSNGRIELHGIDSDFTAETSNGKIDFSGACGDFTVKTSNGSVTCRLMRSWQGRGSVSTKNGRIKVTCDGKLAAAITATTSNGEISFTTPDGTSTHRKSATLNNGQGTLELMTSNGSISVAIAK